MSTESFPIRAESLLQHREFVRALARSLVRDDHAAQDVVQETWLAALRNPPRNATALPGWLARVVRSRAQDAARGESARIARERAVARGELDESEEKLRDRVAMQHKVVEAVLALKEPYKTVVLLHYYEGLSPSQIAARREVPAGSVRAQLSRAHDLLRERLDAEFGGSRAAWSVGLAVLARGRGGVALTVKLAAVGAVATAAAIPVIFWAASPAHDPSPPLAALEPTAATATSSLFAASESAPEPISPASVRSAILAEPAPPQVLPKEELETQSVRQLLQLAIHVQQTLRTKLLTPAEAYKQSYSLLLALPNTGLARILNENKFGTFDSNALGMRGAGTCFSFATRKQEWGDEPDIALARGEFQIQGFGPGILDLGKRKLEELPDAASTIPPNLNEGERAAWEVFWADSGVTKHDIDPSFRVRAGRLGLHQTTPRIGHVYLVRGLTPGAHDVLAAYSPIDKDEQGWTIAWRVLRTWPVDRMNGEQADPYWIMPDPPAAIASQNVQALVELLARIRVVAKAKLYEVPTGLKERYSGLLVTDGTGITRLLLRGRYGPLMDESGGGAYYSFATGAHDQEREPDLLLDQGMYYSGGYGRNTGYLLDLGATAIESIGAGVGSEPDGLNDRGREAWRFLWTAKVVDDGPQGLAISQEDAATALRLELVRTGAEAGHTYLVRSIFLGQHDVLAAFTTAVRDEHGDWIAYRVIWNRKLERTTKPR